MMTIANRITLLRAFLTILMYACIVVPASWTRLAALLIFALASITDWVDGFLARRTNTTTTFGAVADPFVDKLLIGGVFVAFGSVPALHVPLWAVFLIIAREMMISTLRVLAALNREMLAAERSGKFKTAIQMISASLILVILNIQDLAVNGPPDWQAGMQAAAHFTLQFPYLLTIIVMIVTWASGISYLYNHWDMLRRSWSIPNSRRQPQLRRTENRRQRRPHRNNRFRPEKKDGIVQSSPYFPQDAILREAKKNHRPRRRGKRPAGQTAQNTGGARPAAPAATAAQD
ncbi:MAG: CDP-diacylglycerol--glycerol-3-phosphate 3-phosphatidyltransferase [Elusimicrobiaceae bacterium]|nr:CDP-diacylglycerol--glycerol-3-phosphate 3-phosphatidyltransferase [Elusimicrobiaceae bacterium]